MTRYDIVVDFETFEDLHAVALDGKWGIFDSKNQMELLPTIYDDVDVLDINCFTVKFGNFWGVLRSQHDALSEIRYDEIYSFNDELICLVKDGKIRLLSKSTTSTTREYDRILEPIDNYCIVVNNGCYGIICINPLTEILYTRHSWIFHLSDTKYCLNILSNWYIYDVMDSSSILLEYDYLDPIKNYIYAKKGDLRGVIGRDLQIIIPFKYSYISCIGQDLFYVTIGEDNNNLVGIVHAVKGIIIDCKYKNVKKLTDNFFSVTDDSGKCALYDDKNNRLTEFKYDSILYRNHSFFVYVSPNVNEGSNTDENQKQLVGLIDSKGKEVIPPIYDNIVISNNGIIVWKDGKAGIYTSNYHLVSKIIYDDVLSVDSRHADVILNDYLGTFYW